MAYKPGIPLSTDIPSQSQGDISTNFAGLKTFIEIDHVAIDDVKQGKHNKVTLPILATADQPTTGASEVGIFSRTSTETANKELVFLPESTAPADGIEFTAALKNVNGWTRLPSGILLKWGTSDVLAINAGSFSFPVAGTVPVFANVYSGQLTVAQTGRDKTVAISAISTTTVTTWNSSSSTTRVRYLVIGD